jgi:hypothetical protein
MRGSSILHGEGRKVTPVNLSNRIKRPLFARGLRSAPYGNLIAGRRDNGVTTQDTRHYLPEEEFSMGGIP